MITTSTTDMSQGDLSTGNDVITTPEVAESCDTSGTTEEITESHFSDVTINQDQSSQVTQGVRHSGNAGQTREVAKPTSVEQHLPIERKTTSSIEDMTTEVTKPTDMSTDPVNWSRNSDGTSEPGVQYPSADMTTQQYPSTDPVANTAFVPGPRAEPSSSQPIVVGVVVSVVILVIICVGAVYVYCRCRVSSQNHVTVASGLANNLPEMVVINSFELIG